MHSFRYITTGLTLIAWAALATSGCWQTGNSEDNPQPIPVSDSLDATTSRDSLAPSIVPLPPDSTALFRQAVLDTLRRQLAALQASIDALSQADSLQQASTVSSIQAPPDPTQQASADSVASQPTANLKGQLDDAVGSVRYLGLRIITSILLLALFYFIIRGAVWLLDQLSERSATRRLFFKKLVPVFRVMMWMVAMYVIVVYIFNVTQSGLVSAWTAVGVAVGFASQEVLKNIFGGLIIIVDQPFQVGDKISIAGTYGEVVSIGLRSTRIITPDDNLVSVPNAQVVESQVANANAGDLDCQVVVDLYLPGWVDVVKAKSIAYSAAANSKYVYLDKPIVVNVKDEFKETFLTHLLVKAYVLDTRHEFALASEITETAKIEFQRQGFLPPLVQVHSLRQIDGGNRAHDAGVEVP